MFIELTHYSIQWKIYVLYQDINVNLFSPFGMLIILIATLIAQWIFYLKIKKFQSVLGLGYCSIQKHFADSRAGNRISYYFNSERSLSWFINPSYMLSNVNVSLLMSTLFYWVQKIEKTKKVKCRIAVVVKKYIKKKKLMVVIRNIYKHENKYIVSLSRRAWITFWKKIIWCHVSNRC